MGLYVSITHACLTTLGHHLWWQAAVVAFVPSIVVTVALVGSTDLEPYRRTYIGRYVARVMTRKIEALRFAGQLVAWAGYPG